MNTKWFELDIDTSKMSLYSCRLKRFWNSFANSDYSKWYRHYINIQAYIVIRKLGQSRFELLLRTHRMRVLTIELQAFKAYMICASRNWTWTYCSWGHRTNHYTNAHSNLYVFGKSAYSGIEPKRPVHETSMIPFHQHANQSFGSHTYTTYKLYGYGPVVLS